MGFATGLISDCSDNIKRIDYIKELQKYVDVDLFGKCSGIMCPDERNCREWLAQNYKFFLAFENSVCDGYITEKFFGTLRYDILPVVLGAGDYTK